jgi:hypothetical protein
MTRIKTIVAVVIAALVALLPIAATPASAATPLRQQIKAQPHPSLSLCQDSYAIWRLTIARIGRHWDAVAGLTCYSATATTPNEVSVYRLRPGGRVSLIQHLAVGTYNRTSGRIINPENYVLSGRVITVTYSVWSRSDAS